MNSEIYVNLTGACLVSSAALLIPIRIDEGRHEKLADPHGSA